jgi:5'(3')-deoxyribonucleotidase
MDEVVADLMSEWLRLYNLKYNDTLQREQITDWDMRKFVRKEVGEKAYDILRDPILYPGVQPIEGARDGIHQLRSMGYRVVFVTSCVHGSVDAKMAWLKKYHLIDFRAHTPKDFIAAKDKFLVKGEVLIDDGPHNISAFPGHTILFDQPYNRHMDHPHRVRSWEEIPKLVSTLIPCPVA